MGAGNEKELTEKAHKKAYPEFERIWAGKASFGLRLEDGTYLTQAIKVVDADRNDFLRALKTVVMMNMPMPSVGGPARREMLDMAICLYVDAAMLGIASAVIDGAGRRALPWPYARALNGRDELKGCGVDASQLDIQDVAVNTRMMDAFGMDEGSFFFETAHTRALIELLPDWDAGHTLPRPIREIVEGFRGELGDRARLYITSTNETFVCGGLAEICTRLNGDFYLLPFSKETSLIVKPRLGMEEGIDGALDRMSYMLQGCVGIEHELMDHAYLFDYDKYALTINGVSEEDISGDRLKRAALERFLAEAPEERVRELGKHLSDNGESTTAKGMRLANALGILSDDWKLRVKYIEAKAMARHDEDKLTFYAGSIAASYDDFYEKWKTKQEGQDEGTLIFHIDCPRFFLGGEGDKPLEESDVFTFGRNFRVPMREAVEIAKEIIAERGMGMAAEDGAPKEGAGAQPAKRKGR